MRSIVVAALWCAIWCAVSAAALAGWPAGVLNYCGFEGVWDEAGWRDLGWMQGGAEGMRFDREIKRFGKAWRPDSRQAKCSAARWPLAHAT